MILPDVEVRKCKGFPHHYVTEDGRVWSTRTGRFLTASSITPQPDKPELRYHRVCLGGKTRYVHKLVAEVWQDTPFGLVGVRQRDSETGRFTR
jgi:hypothetical protein